MMRWLKEKKKGEKKLNSLGGAGVGGPDDFYQDEEEDDYGFEKEKLPNNNKSPTTKRQLPPTPAAPEEKSPHIYEEIPDLHVSCTPEHERTRLLKNNNKKRERSKGANGNNNNGGGGGGSSSHGNNNRKKSSGGGGGGGGGAPGANNSACLDDSISPYMVVPVDEEVRQTPPHFHRNGTPEMHCDLIVKDTHCEVLLTRKPKVGAFRLDSTTLTGGGGDDNNNHNNNNNKSNGNRNKNITIGSGGGGVGSKGIRNNTHFCSQNRRASVDVQATVGEGSKGASAFSWSSSAFSSSASTSRMNSVGTSSMSLSTLPEHHHHRHYPAGLGGQPQQQQQPSLALVEGDSAGSDGSSAKGVMTYSSASNFIPRSTNLVFKPLTPLDPDFFDAPEETIIITTNRNSELTVLQQGQGQGQNAMLLADENGNTTEYAGIQGQATLAPESDSPVVYSAIQNDDFYDASNQDLGQGQQCRPASPPNLEDIRKCQAMVDNGNGPPFRSSLIRPYSPSISSSCTYASVNFPPESRLYNTIEGLDMPESTAGSLLLSPPPARESEVINYPGSMDKACNEDIASRSSFGKYNTGDFDTDSKYLANLSLSREDPSRNLHRNFAASLSNGTSCDKRARHTSQGSSADGGVIYSGIIDPCDLNLNNDTTYACIDAKDDTDNNITTTTPNHTTSSLLQNKIDGGLVLDFCTCQDYQQYSSCGCSDINKVDDDDNASVATTINEPKSSCSGCGRLIRQITYSESYSDETYEHAYSSRLLLRKGRRFSSPDITVSEISNSESQDVRLRQGSPFGAVSRDDMWPRSQTYDVRSTFYRPDGDTDSLSTIEQFPTEHRVVLDGRDHLADISNTSNYRDRGHPPLTHRKSISAFNNSELDSSSKLNAQNAPGLQHLKRTSLPLNSTLVPTDTSDVKPTRSSAVTQLQPKSSAFAGLFSKFSKPKVKANRNGDDSSESSPQLRSAKNNDEQRLVIPKTAGNNSSTNHIPDKNTLKLSKIFQRLSTKEVACEPQTHEQSRPDLDWKAMTDLQVDLEDSTQKSTQPKTLNDQCSSNQYTSPPQKIHVCKDQTSQEVSKKLPNENKASVDGKSMNNTNNDGNVNSPAKSRKFKNVGDSPKMSNSSTVCAEAPRQGITAHPPISSSENPNISIEGQVTADACVPFTAENASKSKKGNKTDSGDTCYEYDISTSSESEHTSYDYFLSKVKKSLNLEKEVQHIADMNALRKKLLCKLCKKGSMPDQCEMCGVDGACTHVSSLKCSDWRKFFGEFVVDQRAAILDCLTDYTHSPYTVKGDGLADGTHQCRECGGEIMTSDSESLTTVYSLLSQHLRMTSPGAHTPSCDSDEGTMADNSCESADERDEACLEDADSSGFDDEEGYGDRQRVGLHGKPKKPGKSLKDKRDKKDHLAHSQMEHASRRRRSQSSTVSQEDANIGKGKSISSTYNSASESSTNNGSTPSQTKSASKRNSGSLGVKHQKTCSGSHQSHNDHHHHHHHHSQSTILSTSYSMDDIASTQKVTSSSSGKTSNSQSKSKDCDHTARTKTSLLATDRAIQDIYAPLPSKALSWLTTRHGTLRTANPCACSRISPSSSVGALAQKSETGMISLQEKTPKEKGRREGFDQTSDVSPQEPVNSRNGIKDVLLSHPLSQFEKSSVDAKPSEDVKKSLIEKTQVKKILADKHSVNGGLQKETSTANSGSDVQGPTLEPKLSPGLNLARRRSRQLSLAALDLLPETAFGSDVVEESEKHTPEKDERSNVSQTLTDIEKPSSVNEKPQKPRLVERMTRLFEGSNATAKDLSTSQVKAVSNSIVAAVRAINEGCSSTSVTEVKSDVKKLHTSNDSGKRDDDEMGTSRVDVVYTAPDSNQTLLQAGSSEKKALNARSILSQALSRVTQPQMQSQAGPVVDLLEATKTATATSIAASSVTPKLMEKSRRPSESTKKEQRHGQSSPRCSRGDKTATKVKRRNSSSFRRESSKSRTRAEVSLSRRQSAPPSPSPSTDSSSSSTSSASQQSRRGREGQSKQRRLSKKSQLAKKVKTKIGERKKRKKREGGGGGGGGKEEKTYYCFSSDISDIDVVEVEDWDTYSSQRSSSISESKQRSRHGSSANTNHQHDLHSGKGKHHSVRDHGSRHHHHRRERSASRRRSLGDRDTGQEDQSSSRDKRKKHLVPSDITSLGSEREASGKEAEVDEISDNNNDEDDDDDELVQEIYAMPPNSSEVCEVKGHRDNEDATASPTASPELSKLKKKSKRTDIYKTKKSNNRLLSDLIIRNYDRQVFGNV